MNKSKILPYIEGAFAIAMSMVLSFAVIFKLPWGGEVTLLSMLPIAVYSIKHGLKRGLAVSFVFALFRFAQGIGDGIFAWGLTPAMLTACIFLDYIFAYTAIGLAGMFRKKDLHGWVCGTVTAMMLRFACHFISGVVVFHSAGKLWEGFATENTYLYSLLYNGCYMLPEITFTCIGAVIMFKVPVIKRMVTVQS